MKDLGYGAGYRYDPSEEDGVAAQDYLPDRLRGARFYEPSRFGFERTVAERLAWWAERRARSRQGAHASGAQPEAGLPDEGGPDEGP
jgi:putative ATPase